MIAYSIFPYDPRIRRESEALVRYGNKVNFLVLAEKDRPALYKSNDVTIIEMGVKKYRGKKNLSYFLSYTKFLVLTFLTCTKLFLRHQVDVVHIHNMPNFLVFAGIIPRLFGKKLILDIHDSMPETYKGKFGNLPKLFYKLLCIEESLCCAFVHKIICVNDIQRDELVKRGIPSKKITVILNVPDNTIFKFESQRAEACDNNKRDFNIVYHGTIDRMLGIDLTVEAVSRLLNEIPGIQFYVLGAGRDLDEFISLGGKLGIEDHIHFTRKYYPVESLPLLLKDMDLGIIPSRKNAATDLMLPVKLLEYVAIGIPVVAARLKTIEHYFSNDMVCYFEAEDVESMVSAILKIYKDENGRREQALKARKFIDKYGWDRHQMDLIRLYDSL